MDKPDQLLEEMRGINLKLHEINANMLKVFWIVAIFALLYFGLMIFLLFFK